MMRKAGLIAAAALLSLLVGLHASAYAADTAVLVTSGELVEKPKQYDGEVVEFTGEVIGEAMVRGDHVWLHVNDDEYAEGTVADGASLSGYNSGQAVWADAAVVDRISYFGTAHAQGDRITVTGTFNAACVEHGGDMDIHATDIDVIEVGHPLVEEWSSDKLLWALGLVTVAGALYFVDRNWERLRGYAGLTN